MLARYVLFLASCSLSSASPAHGQFLLVPDINADRLMLFSAEDGSVIDPNFISLAETATPPPGTPLDVVQVGIELWITDSTSDSIYRYDATDRKFLGTVGKGHNNLNGVTASASGNGNVWVASGIPTIGLREYDANGMLLQTHETGIGVLDVLDFGGELLVSTGNSARIDRFAYDGTPLGVFSQLGSIEPVPFAGALSATPSGHILVGAGTRIIELDSDGIELVSHNPGPFEQAAVALPGGTLFYTAANQVGLNVPGSTTSEVLMPSPEFPGGISPRFIGEFDGGGAFSTPYCDATASSVGVPVELSALGFFSVAAGSTELYAIGAPIGTNGMFFYGAQRAHLPFGNGVLCISPFATGIFRLPPVVVTDFFGDATYNVDLSALSGAGAITGGSTWNFQFWFRDPDAGGTGFNLSTAVSIPFIP